MDGVEAFGEEFEVADDAGVRGFEAELFEVDESVDGLVLLEDGDHRMVVFLAEVNA